MCEHTHVHFNYDTKNKCTFKDIFLKVEKKEIKKIYEQLFNCFTEFYKSIIGLLSDKIGETNMSWNLLWEIKKIQYEFGVMVYFTDEPSAITWSDFNPYAEWRPNKEILS